MTDSCSEQDKNNTKMDHSSSDINYKQIITSAERKEYFNKLERWLIEVYAWQSFISTFPYYLASSQILNVNSANSVNITSSNIGFTLSNTQINVNNQRNNINNESLRQRRINEPLVAQFQAAGIQGFEYRIPSIWKRFVAESIDSLILFVLKVLITFIAVDLFDFINIEKYYLDMIQTNLRIDYKMALELTSEILKLELIHRIFVCVFEAIWLQHGRNGHIGGATPGKTLMGLKVVSCQSVTPIRGLDNSDIVFVSPGNDLGLLPSLGRSVLKNLILAFFFPVCFALCFFKFNRTGYDLVCNSIVVEDSYLNGNNNMHNNNNIYNFNNNNVNNINIERNRQQ